MVSKYEILFAMRFRTMFPGRSKNTDVRQSDVLPKKEDLSAIRAGTVMALRPALAKSA
jgi:hypothetical protein